MIKRKRNQKLENDIQYVVYSVSDVNEELLDSYMLTNISTGMELEEEKEHHLKTIITCGSGEIPTPIIEIDENFEEPTEFKRGERLIKFSEDAENNLIIPREEILKAVENSTEETSRSYKNSMDQSFYVLNDLVKENAPVLKSSGLFNYLEKAQIRTSIDCNGAYTCFRKRIVKITRKTRKNEANIGEKIKKLWVELNYNKVLYDLHLTRCNLRAEYFEVYNEILEKIRKIKNQKLRKKIEKKFYRKKNTCSSEYFRSCGTYMDLITDNTKIKVLKELICKVDPKLNSVELEKEVKILESFIGYFEKGSS